METFPVLTTQYVKNVDSFSFQCPGCQQSINMIGAKEQVTCNCGVVHTLKHVDITVESRGECSKPTKDLKERYDGHMAKDLEVHRKHMGTV